MSYRLGDETTFCQGCDVSLKGEEVHFVSPMTLAAHACFHGDVRSWGEYEQCRDCQSEHFGVYDYCARCYHVAQSIAASLAVTLNLQRSPGDEY